MFFKTSLFILCLGLGTLSGCSWLRDKPKTMASLSSNSLDVGCLNTAPDQLQKLFAGEYTSSPEDQKQVNSIWFCLDKALDVFATNTRGAKPDVYSAQELQTFGNLFLPKDRQLTTSFVNSIFNLKKAVLGGSNAEITAPEIKRLRAKLVGENIGDPAKQKLGFAQMILPLSQYMGTLLNPSSLTGSPEKHAAAAALNQFVLNFANLLRDSQNSLQWVDLTSFIGDLEKFTSKGKPTALTLVREQMGIYQYFKLLVVGGDEYAIESAKWLPIFESLSHFYSAVFLSTSTQEMTDQLYIKVESTDLDQKLAINKLSGLLKVLKLDHSLSSTLTIKVLSDQTAKALTVSAILFPRSRESVDLKTLLGSPGLLKLAGYLFDEFKGLKSNSDDPAKIQMFADNLGQFISQASTSNSSSDSLTPLSLDSLREYLATLRPLFSDDKDYQTALIGVDLFQNLAPLLCGKDSDTFLAKDFNAAIQRAVSLYLAWRQKSPDALYEQIGKTFDVILAPPASFYSIKLEQLLKATQDAEKLTTLLEIKSSLDWEQINSTLVRAFHLKSLLFGSSEKTLSGFELSTLADLWKPIRSGANLPASLESVSTLLNNNTFASIPMDQLVPAVEAFLPKTQTLETMGLDINLLGLIKGALVGGKPGVLNRKEYAPLVLTAAKIWSRIKPVLDQSPSQIHFDLNAKAMELASAAVDGLADGVAEIPYDRLRPLFLAFTKKAGYTVRESTLEKLLVGLSTRLFGRTQIQPKPERAIGSLTSSQLRPVALLLKTIQNDFEEIEATYQGLKPEATLTRSVLLSKIQSNYIKAIIQEIPPILDGTDHLLHISGHGIGNDFSAFDLLYKTMIKRALEWGFPAYQLEEDSGKASGRLTMNDLTDLLTDINELILDLKLTYGVHAPAETAKSRMQTVNLFMKSGNGDDFLDIGETTEFLTITLGGMVLLDGALKTLIADCKIDTRNGANNNIPYPCLDSHFTDPKFIRTTYGALIPELVKQYESFSVDDRRGFVNAMYISADPFWEDKTEMSFSDFEVFIGVPYYAEDVFDRLDTNHDQIVNFTEAMSGFPLFCGAIQKAAGASVKGSCAPGAEPRQIEAVYGYLLFNGEAPRSPKLGDGIFRKIGEIASLLSWFNHWKHLDRDPEIRDSEAPQLSRKDLLQIISNLAASTAPAQETAPLTAATVTQ